MINPNKVDISKLKTGDVVLQHTISSWYRPDTWAAGIIRLCTKSKWNHSGEIIKLDGDIYVLEALGGGITLTPWSEFNNYPKRIKIIRYKGFENEFDLKDYMIKGLRQLDKRYDYYGILKIFVNVCTGYRSNPEKQISETKRWCSEFNAWMKDIRGRQSYVPGDFDGDEHFEDIFN